MVGPPLRLLEIDVRPVELIAHHAAAEVVLFESRHGFKERLRQLPDAALLELVVGELIHIDELRIAGIEVLLDAVEPRAQEHGGGKIGIGRRIDGAAFPPRAGEIDVAVAGIAPLDMRPEQRYAEHVRPVVAAVRNEDRRPGVSGHRAGLDQALVGIDGRATHRDDRRRVLAQAAEELIGALGEAAAAFVARIARYVLAGIDVGERHVEMRAGSRPVGIGLGHHGGLKPVLPGQLLHHQAPHHETVGHGHRVGIGKVELELAVGVFMIEGMHLPAELVHRRDDVVEELEVEKGEARVVGGLGNGVARIVRRDAVMRRGIAPHDVSLAFDADVELQSELGGALDLLRQHRA